MRVLHRPLMQVVEDGSEIASSRIVANTNCYHPPGFSKCDASSRWSRLRTYRGVVIEPHGVTWRVTLHWSQPDFLRLEDARLCVRKQAEL